jgi:hypothetical protein
VTVLSIQNRTIWPRYGQFYTFALNGKADKALTQAAAEADGAVP